MSGPERIWIDAWGGNWSPRSGGTQEIEYIRADLVDPAAIREAALREAASALTKEADKCEDAAKWGGHRQYVANCKAAAYALRDQAAAILALIDKPAPDHSAAPGNMIDKDAIARAICREQCAVYGEPPCYQVGPWPCTNCDEPGCQALAASVARAMIGKGAG